MACVDPDWTIKRSIATIKYLNTGGDSPVTILRFWSYLWVSSFWTEKPWYIITNMFKYIRLRRTFSYKDLDRKYTHKWLRRL